MPALTLQLNISADKILGYYRGQIRSVTARATNGQTVQFPVSALHKFILPNGVHGRYRLIFDDQHKFVGIEPVAAGE